MLDVGATDGAIGKALAPVAANGPSTAEARIARTNFRIVTPVLPIANNGMLIAPTVQASVAAMDNANVQSVRAMG